MSFLGVMFAPTGFHQFWWKFDETRLPPHTISKKIAGSGSGSF